MWKSREESRFMVAAVLLLLAAVYFWTAAAVSGMEVSAGELETYYSEKERELVAEARAFLDREGFRNSGVMLTRVVDEDGRRQYTLTVHHGKIDDGAENPGSLPGRDAAGQPGENYFPGCVVQFSS